MSWASLALLALTGGGIVALYNHEKQKRVQGARLCAAVRVRAPLTQAAELLARSAPKSVGKAASGGAWQLVDQNGKPFSNADLKGKFALLYFGFTHCPDICPDELVKMAEAIDLIGACKRTCCARDVHTDGCCARAEKQTGKQVQPVFISIDPERDSVKQVRDYVKGALRQAAWTRCGADCA